MELWLSFSCPRWMDQRSPILTHYYHYRFLGDIVLIKLLAIVFQGTSAKISAAFRLNSFIERMSKIDASLQTPSDPWTYLESS